ncbi:MAG: PLP-dependent aminotransferase family protein [Kocuria rhizophila]|nr:PLP-dependent aminotransferase family protein [Kocuria rhizophila]
MRHPREIDLPLTLDRTPGAPLGEQLVRQVRELVARGVLHPGDPLPSSRALAARLGISRGTVTAAWDVLNGEGYLVADRGATRITPSLAPVVRSAPSLRTTSPGEQRNAAARRGGSGTTSPGDPSKASAGWTPARRGAAGSVRNRVARSGSHLDLRPGAGPVVALDTPAWRGAWRDAAGATALGDSAETSLRGHLSDHLRLNRGIVRAPEEILVTAGVRDGLQLVLRVLGTARRRPLRVAVENPGYPALRRVVEATGHTALPVRVDQHGLDPAVLPAGRWGGAGRWDVAALPDVLVVTPGHQYPLGGTMTVDRRVELLGWAREHGTVVVEDDYDSELRHTGQPLPALGALDTPADTVVTLGSFSKVLGGSVALGHLVAPAPLLPGLLTARADLGSPVSLVGQDALARFMGSGEFQRHTARMRRSFRRRRSLVSAALAGIPGVAVAPMAGGAHAVVEVADESRVLALARERGVLVSGLREYWTARPGEDGVGGGAAAVSSAEGLVLGLTASDEDLTRGTAVLRRILREAGGS